MLRNFLFLLFIFPLLITNAQNSAKDSPRVFTDVQLKEDWRIFRKALTEAHPATYRYISKQNLDFFFDSVNTSLDHPITEVEFMKLLMLGVARIRCVHTNVNFSEQYYKNHPDSTATILPLAFRYLNEEAFIRKNWSGDSITKIIGLKVTSINGRSMQSYTHEFYPLLKGDGFIETSRYAQLGGEFHWFYNHFIGEPDTFLIDCEHPSTKEKIALKIPAITMKEAKTEDKGRNKEKKTLSYKILNNETALIKMNSFLLSDLRKKKQAPYKFLRTTFKDIRRRNIQHVIIDLRNNGGGHGDYCAKLFSYFRDSSFRCDESQLVKAIKFDQEYMQYRAKHQFKSIHPANVTKTDSGDYAVKNRIFGGLLKPWQPVKKPFKGNAYLLISGATYSAASQFASTFNTYHRGPIIGEETGGQSYGSNGYWRINIVLPNTEVRIHIPLVSTRTYCKSFTYGRGVMPTYEIDSTERIKALMNGADPELDYALRLIKNDK